MSVRVAAVRPPRLAPGSRVALISPAGAVTEDRIAEAIARCRALELEPVLGSAARERHGYLAGTDDLRARDFQHALDEPSIDAIWALRGGYGTMRLIASLDLARLRERPCAFIGFSDNTAVHLAIARAGVVSFHGPHAGGPWSAFTESCFRRMMYDPSPAGELPLPHDAAPPVSLNGGTAEGELVGGNLTLVAALCGTTISLDARGRIVFFEDVGEAIYRLDRALAQLMLSGVLDGAAGLALGQFTERPEQTDDRGIEDVFGEAARSLGVPAVLGFPIGHTADNWCVPMNVRATLDASRGTLSIDEPAVA